MANDAAGTTWNEAEPTLADPRALGQQEIRGLRTGVRLRPSREHETLAGASAGGEHKSGSAKGYRQDDAPSLRPDGTTALTAADNGRIWFDSNDGNKMYVYVHPSWIAISGAITTTALVALAGGDLTNLRSDSGYTNATGKLIQIYCDVREVASNTITIEYNHAAAGWIQAGVARHGGVNFDATLSVLVANGSAVRLRLNGAALPAGNLLNARYQQITI